MLKKFGNKLIFLAVGAMAIALALFLLFNQQDEASKPSLAASDLSRHPVYSSYSFDNAPGVVNIGIQPLYSSTGFIMETIRRDLILRDALKELGFSLRFYSFLKGDDVNYFLKKGSLAGGIGGDMPTLSLASETKVIIPSLVQRGYTSIVSRSHILLEELAGKRIAYAFGSNAHYGLLHALEGAGLSENDVKLIRMDVNAMPKAMKEGKVEAFSAWEPTPFLALRGNPGAAIIHRHISTGYLYFLGSFHQKHPDVVHLIVAAEIRAINWLREDRTNLALAIEWNNDSIERLTDKQARLPKDLAISIAQDDILQETSSPIIPEKKLKEGGQLQNEFIFLKKLGRVRESTDWQETRECFDRSIITGILNASSKYRLEEFAYDIMDYQYERD